MAVNIEATPLTADLEAHYRAEVARGHYLTAPAAAWLFATLDASRAREKALVEALEAHHAWSYAEHNGLGTFDLRGTLCAHAESLTARALFDRWGRSAPEYRGRKSLIVWPSVYISETDEADARQLVTEVLAHERAAYSAPTEPEAPSDVHPQECGQ